MANQQETQFTTKRIGLAIQTTNQNQHCTKCGGSLIFYPSIAASYRKYRTSTTEPAYTKCVDCGAVNNLTKETADALARHVLDNSLFSFEEKCAASAVLEGGK